MVNDLIEYDLPLAPPPTGEFCIRIGAGKEDGFLKIGPEAWAPDRVVDLAHFPWPIASEIVDRIMVVNHFQRLTRPERYAFMDEAWRILKPGAQIALVTPYWASAKAFADPLAEWPPIAELSYLVYSKVWREIEGLSDFGLKCDFTHVTPQGGIFVPAGHVPDPEVALRNDEFRMFAAKHYVNAIQDLHVTLTKT